jgi:hypothetical protein
VKTLTESDQMTPATVIRDIHLLGQEMQFRRLRVDRSGYGGTDEWPDAWFEVGYGCREIKIRTSVEGVEYRANWDKVEMVVVVDLLAELIESVYPSATVSCGRGDTDCGQRGGSARCGGCTS